MGFRQDTHVPELNVRCGGIIEAFFKNLSPNEKELFKATIIAEQLLEEITIAEKAHKNKSISRKVSQALKPFLAGVSQYGQALDVVSNASSMVLCPFWGGVRVILHLATEFGEYFEKVGSMLQQIGLNLNSLRRFPKLYPHNDRLALAMVDVYQRIFDFCSEARKVFVEARERRSKKICVPLGLQTMSKLVWKPFKIQFGEIQEQLSACMERVEIEVDLAEKEEAHHERKRAEAERRTQSFRWEKTEMAHRKFEGFIEDQNIVKVNQWLSPARVELNHTAAMKLRHSGTGRWFLGSEAFRDWLDGDNTFLWIHAIPGAGKTILLSSIIEYLKENICSADVGLAYFYCDYKEMQKQEPSNILSTLLCQLGTRNAAIFHQLQSYFQERYKENPAFSPGFDELRGQFPVFLEGSSDQVLLVVDALDECTQRDCIASALKTIFESCPMVKIIVSSRQEREIAHVFEELPEFRITQSHMAPDIESFVKAEIAGRIKSKKLKIRKPELQSIICDMLVAKADGMFQWVKCQIEVLTTLGTDKLILTALDNLPRDLVGTYSRILERIDREHEHLESVQRLLQWLVKGTRSLSLDELAECIGIDLDEDNDEMDFGAILTDPQDVLNLCGSLVTLSEGGQVSLAHYTVKEFLLSDTARNKMPSFYVGGDEVEAALAKTCLTYLNYSDFVSGAISDEDRYRDLIGEYRFLGYTAQSWAVHASRAEEDVEELILGLLRSDEGGRGNLLLWSQVFQCCKAAGRFVVPTSVDSIYYASLFGLPRSLQFLLEQGTNLDLQDADSDPLKAAVTEGHGEVVKILLGHGIGMESSNLDRYLYIAASKGHDTLVVTLLEKGASIDSNGGKQGTALQIAALEGHKEVVQTLLEHGASTKIVSARFGTPLTAAAEKGHQGCFQLLLNAGASIHGKGGWYAYPLVSALVGKNDVIIQILLNKGANVNLTGGRHVCALMAASAVSKIEWVEKLIKAGAKVNDENDKGADALHSACCAKRLEVVKLLLDNGADVNAKGGRHRNALNAASSSGCLSIVVYLLNAGADASAFDESYGTALQAAVLGGHCAIVEELAPKCDVNAPGGVKGSALVIAANIGDVTMLRTLFNLGVQTGLTSDMAQAMLAASAKGHQQVIKILIAKQADVNGIGIYKAKKWTPLQVAASKGDIDTVNYLISLGADPNVEADFKGTALIAATDTAVATSAKLHVIQALLDAGATIDKILDNPTGSGSWNTALASAVGSDNNEVIALLLARGANVNLARGTCWTALQAASNVGNPEVLTMLFHHGADPNLEIEASDSPDDDGIITALQEAAHYGSVSTIQLLVSHGADLVLSRDDSRFKSAVHAASFAGKLENVNVLIELGCDVESRGGFWGTSLQAAAFRGQVEVMTTLLDAGADVNASNVGHYGTALMAALDHDNDDNLAAVKLLLSRGADPSLRAKTDIQFPLHAACWHGSDDVVNALVGAGADVNAYGGKFHSALQAAAAMGQHDIMAVLIGGGADVNATGGMYGTAFAAAYCEGYYQCTNLLYDHDASNGILAGKYGSPLGAALNGACQTLVTFFIKRHDGDPNRYLGKRLGSPLHHCINARYWAGEGCDAGTMVDLLLEHGAKVNDLGPNGFGGRWGTPLNCAAWEGSLDIMRTLLNAGADINLQAKGKGFSALQLACLSGNGKAVDLLLEKGANINSHGSYGTPLQAASYKGNTKIAQKLLLRGARVDHTNQGRYGHALQSAVIRGHEEVAKLLIKRGADINVEGGRFGSFLQAASMRCSTKFIKFLLKKGAKVDHQGGRYQTALQAAAAAGRGKVVSVLLQHGADINVRGGRYGSALQAACVFGKLKTVRVLVDHGAEANSTGGFYGNALSAAVIKERMEIAKYLIAKAGATATTVDRRPDNQNTNVYDETDRLLGQIQKSLLDEGTTKNASNINVNADDEQESSVDPDEANDAASEVWEDDASDGESTNPTSSSDKASDQGLPTTGKQTEIVEQAVEEVGEGGTELQSPLSWLQVECGYGGDLSGPGR